MCRQVGISEATLYTWKKKHAELGLSELHKLRQPKWENARLRRSDVTIPSSVMLKCARNRANFNFNCAALVATHLVSHLTARLTRRCQEWPQCGGISR